MSQHSATPWFVSARWWVMGGDRIIVHTDGQAVEDQANAERIVACVNACAGLANPEEALRLLANAEGQGDLIRAAEDIVMAIQNHRKAR